MLQFKATQHPYLHGQRMRLLSAQCEPYQLLCHYAHNFYAILLPSTNEAKLQQLQICTEQLFKLVHWETNHIQSAIAMGQQGERHYELLERCHRQLSLNHE